MFLPAIVISSKVGNPLSNSHAFGIENIIDSRESRPLLVYLIKDAYDVIAGEIGKPSLTGYRPQRTVSVACYILSAI